MRAVILLVVCLAPTTAWVIPTFPRATRRAASRLQMSMSTSTGNTHGQNSCFLPLQQLDQDYYAPRIVQIAGSYPGLTAEDIGAVTSEPAPEPGQWTYDFSDPEGPQMGTVAIQGSTVVYECDEPIVIIAEHFSIGVELPAAITDPVDLVILVDRAKTSFKERKFLVFDVPGAGVTIAAYPTKKDMPDNAIILGQVEMVQIPWLPSMESTKTGFMEADEYF